MRNGVLLVLALLVFVACLRGWRANVGCVGGVLAWVTCQRGWWGLWASVGGVGIKVCIKGVGVGGVLKWVALVILHEIDSIVGGTLFLKISPEIRRKWILIKARKKNQLSGHTHFEHILIFRVSPGCSNLKLL